MGVTGPYSAVLNSRSRQHRSAVISEDRLNRYALEQRLNTDLFQATRGRVMFLMLNPSLADAHTDDLTFTKCVGFATRWGYQDLSVGNLFAIRETHPEIIFPRHQLPRVPDALSDPEAHRHLLRMASSSRAIVCAWGDCEAAGNASVRILNNLFDTLPSTPFMCLGTTRQFFPRHPSRLGYDAGLVSFQWYRRVRVEVWAGPAWRNLRECGEVGRASPLLRAAFLPVPYWIRHGSIEMAAIIGFHLRGLTTPGYVRSGRSWLYKLYPDDRSPVGVRGIGSSIATAEGELGANPDWHREDLLHFPEPHPFCQYPTLGIDGTEEQLLA